MKKKDRLQVASTEKSNKLGIGTFLAWNSRAVSVSIQIVILTYFNFYCTDVLGMNAALVATLLMATKLIDGITDIFAGYLIDITHTKLGRARPYEIFLIPFWICTWLLFSVPTQYSTVVKCVWIVIAYTLTQSVCATLLGANQNAYMVRAFNNQEKYVTISSFGGLFIVFFVALFNVFLPTLVERAGKDAASWSRMMLMIGLPLLIIGMMRFFFIKEEYDVDVSSEKLTLKAVKELLIHNKYIYYIAAMCLLYNLISGLGVTIYYYTYIVGNVSIMGVMGLFSVVPMVTMLIYPKLLKKISVKKLVQFGCLICAAGQIINFFAKGNLLVLGVAAIVIGIGVLPLTMMSNLMLIECADYNEWCGRPRMEGTLGSVIGLAIKIGSALGSLVCGVLLTRAGYVGTLAVLPDSAIMMIRILWGVIPATLYLLLAFILHGYDLDKKIDGMRAENEARREEKIEVEA